MDAPTPVQDISAGQQAFERDLEKALKGRSPEELGWAIPDSLTLLVPLWGEKTSGDRDFYLLRLYFDHYPAFPPSARFVNPATLEYRYPEDKSWVPNSPGHGEIQFHTNYSSGRGHADTQLICCSQTLEFYTVNHSVEEQHLWNPAKHNFMSTLSAIRRLMVPPYYQGRAET